MTENCDLCDMSLTPSTARGSRCVFCRDGITINDLHLWTPDPTPPPYVKDSISIDAFSEGSSYDLTTDSWGIMCTYCEDVFSPDDMNNTIDRWLCNQCYSDHVLEQ